MKYRYLVKKGNKTILECKTLEIAEIYKYQREDFSKIKIIDKKLNKGVQ